MPKTKNPTGPRASRPRFPRGYGIPKTAKGLLPWSFVDERMTRVGNYWVCTTRPDGRCLIVSDMDSPNQQRQPGPGVAPN
ncbi:MAG: hypothetical protein ACRD35_01075 [Candidatus Acidiferrales bacterium]